MALNIYSLNVSSLGLLNEFVNEIQCLAGVRSQGSSAATQESISSFQCWTFSGSADNNLYMTVDMPHNWKKTSNLPLHIHFFNENNTAGNVIWQATYSVSLYNTAIDTTGTVLDSVTVANSTTYNHFMTDLGNINMSSINNDGACVLIKLTRLGGSDSYNGKSYLISCGIHYTCNRFGSSAV